MPNYKLSPKIIEHMIAVGNNLCERRVSHMQTGFPISRNKIQEAILPAKWRKVILEMKAEGVAALWSCAEMLSERRCCRWT